MASRVSAGILLYRRSGGRVEVLLAHPGGPYFEAKDLGHWTIPKGEVDVGEELEAVARREFEAKPENRIIVQETLERARPVVAAMTGGSRTVSVSKGCLPRARRILDALARLSALVRVP